jgi:hypothetical protein
MRVPPLTVAAVLVAAAPAFAYRPFDGTDAAVAERGQLEVELGPVQPLREGSDTFLIVPAVVANFGFAEGFEVVLEGRHHVLLGAPSANVPRTRLADTALSVKTVVRRGELQDQDGPSVAMEVGVLLPTVNDEPGVGAQTTVIVSRRFSIAVLHVNAGIAYNRAHNVELVGSMIVEGPPAWRVKPVLELFSEDDLAGPFAATVLAGVIWLASDSLSFDAGLRIGRAAGQPLSEGRLGLTFAIDVLGGG